MPHMPGCLKLMDTDLDNLWTRMFFVDNRQSRWGHTVLPRLPGPFLLARLIFSLGRDTNQWTLTNIWSCWKVTSTRMWSSSIRGFRCSIDPCPRHKNDSVCWSQKPVGESRHWCWSWALHADPVGDKLLINCAQQISISSEPVPLDLSSARKVISAMGRSHYSDRSTNPNAAWDKSCKRPDKNAYCWSGLSDRLFDIAVLTYYINDT